MSTDGNSLPNLHKVKKTVPNLHKVKKTVPNLHKVKKTVPNLHKVKKTVPNLHKVKKTVPNLHKVKKTVPNLHKVTTSTTTTTTTATTTTKTTATTSGCPKWLMIPDYELADYDATPVHNCTECNKAGRTSYKHPFVVHNVNFADYVCFQCGDDVNVCYVCWTCRALKQTRSKSK